MKVQVKITAFALNQFSNIIEYFRAGGYPKRSERLKKELKNQLVLLSKNPNLGQEEYYLKALNQGHRYLLIKPCYKIIYIQIENIVYITDIFDTRQYPEKINP